MQQIVVFLLLALFVQSYYAINRTPTPSDIQSILDGKLIPILCNDDCDIADSYIHFREYYKDNRDILRELPTFTLFKDYLSKEGDLDRINSVVTKYAENVGFCYDTPKGAIAGSAIAGSAIAGSAIAGSAIAGSAIAGTAIVVTDMQGAFMSNGPVAVNGSEYAIDPINKAKKYHEHSIHSLDTHLALWSLSFSTTPDYVTTFYPHARPGTADFNEVYRLDTCADLYVGKKDFAITSNPLFKEYLLKNGIRKVTFTGVAGDYCVYAGILGVLGDPQLSHVQVGLYEPGVKWVFPDSINSQKLNLESYSKFKWINDEEKLLHFLNN
jgi:nicotinamidase-related amidase